MTSSSLRQVILSVVTSLCLIILHTGSLATVSVRFDQAGLVPENQHFLTDDSLATCVTFQHTVARRPPFTKFRIEVPIDDVYDVKFAIRGINLGCDDNLHVAPLSDVETRTWTGRWRNCYKRGIFQDLCFYHCECSSPCKEVQIAKWIVKPQNMSWTVCDVCFIYNDVVNDCSGHCFNYDGIYKYNYSVDGSVYYLKEVFCEVPYMLVMSSATSQLFNRSWEDYKNGFFMSWSDFWIGNDFFHYVTTKGRCMLSIWLNNITHDYVNIKFDVFSVGPESDGYRLNVSGYSSDFGVSDSLERYHNGCMFSTWDRNNCLSTNNLAVQWSAPWWYCYEAYVKLTAPYRPPQAGYNSSYGLYDDLFGPSVKMLMFFI